MAAAGAAVAAAFVVVNSGRVHLEVAGAGRAEQVAEEVAHVGVAHALQLQGSWPWLGRRAQRRSGSEGVFVSLGEGGSVGT